MAETTKLECRWMNAGRYENHVSCAPQHDDDNQQCPHNSDPRGICTCEVADNLGWELKWTKPSRRVRGWEDENGYHLHSTQWSDDHENYDIVNHDDRMGEYRVVCCDGTHIGTVATLDEAKALAQREYAGIEISIYGSREDYDSTHNCSVADGDTSDCPDCPKGECPLHPENEEN